MFKFPKSYFHFLLSNIVAGQKNYGKWKKQSYSLREEKIKDHFLAEELESEAKKREGFLTLEEYFEIDQFGRNGYHAKNKYNGDTSSYKTWGEAFPVFCERFGFRNIVDVGAGSGMLGINIISYAKNKGINLKWNAVERNIKLHSQIYKNFKKTKLLPFLGKIETDIAKLDLKEKSLIIFSYCLDSIATQVFLNTGTNLDPPNAVLGVLVKSGVLKEIILSKENLRKRGISLENGIYKRGDFTINLTHWNLEPYQRAFINAASFEFLKNVIEHAPKGSAILMIDEFSILPKFITTDHLSVPKDMESFIRDIYDFNYLYRTSGKNLLYFTNYLPDYISIFRASGLRDLRWAPEEIMVEQLIRKKDIDSRFIIGVMCFCLFGFKRESMGKIALLPGPWKGEEDLINIH